MTEHKSKQLATVERVKILPKGMRITRTGEFVSQQPLEPGMR